MDSVRLRVEFEDGHILSKSQRSEGLKRSWLLLKQPHETISDLSTYLTHLFDLYHSCPNGIVLSMDGFVLPPFESTCILKDEDTIRVKRKGGMLLEIEKEGDGADSVEEDKIEKQPVLIGLPLLANEEFEKESGHLSELEDGGNNQEEDALHVENSPDKSKVSKKRKATIKLQGSSTKKKKKCTRDTQEAGNDLDMEQDENCGLHPGNSIKKKKKVADMNCKPKKAYISGRADRDNNSLKHSPCPNGSGQLEENVTGCGPQGPDETKKVPSRSARRKKAKREWLKELKRAEKKQAEEKELAQMQILEEDTHGNSLEHQQDNQKSEVDDDIVADENIVPIVIRPGHIRFEPLEKDQDVQRNPVSLETFQWNGMTGKKMGQKWGKQKLSSWRNNDNEPNKKHYEMMTIKKVNPANDPIDFDKLAPFTTYPTEGDVIAYRLVELLSNWTPELSSFRVGKISNFDPKSNTILLTQLPEYPISSAKDEDACVQSADSLYGEDGSLKIHFKTLIDVRIVKHGNSAPAETRWVNDSPVLKKFASSAMVPGSNQKQTQTSNLDWETLSTPPQQRESNANIDWETLLTPSQKREANASYEINRALSAQKAVIQENSGRSGTSGRSPWSRQAPRRNGIGQTMAILRARKNV